MFRFTIRDLLWLTVVVAFAVLWLMEYRQRGLENVELRAEKARLVQELERTNGGLEAARYFLNSNGFFERHAKRDELQEPK
jgi:hypothetical protein